MVKFRIGLVLAVFACAFCAAFLRLMQATIENAGHMPVL